MYLVDSLKKYRQNEDANKSRFYKHIVNNYSEVINLSILNPRRIGVLLLIIIASFSVACSGETEVVQEIVVETVVVEKEVIQEVEKVVEKEVEKIVVKEVPVETEKVVTKEKVEAPPPAPETLKVGVALVTPGNFIASKIPWPSNLNLTAWGVAEGLLYTDYAPPPQIGALNKEGIAEDWTIAPDQSKVTFKIREGIKFHGDEWGELDAYDVAHSFNEAIQEGSTWARMEMADHLDEAVAVDERTVDWNFSAWISTWYGWMWNVTGSTPMTSKKAYDELGPDVHVKTPVFTGPFSVDEWKANDIVKLSAVKDHWRKAPSVDKVEIIEIPEVAARLAAFKTGEIHITQLPNNFLRDAINSTGGDTVMVGQPASKHVAFGGNYWIKEDHTDGATIFPRPGLLADKDHPWIGDTDDETSMENARQIRQAMAMAIDRDLINEQVLDDLGAPSYSWYGFAPGMPDFKDEWIIPYDPEGAKKIFADQGYPDGFKVPFFLPPDVPAVVTMEIGEAIAQMWGDVGLTVEIENTAYQARRPTMVARSLDVVWMWQHDAVGVVDTAQTQGVIPSKGWNRGMEIPWVLETWQKNKDEDDGAVRTANNVAAEDLSRFWMTVAPVVDVSNLWVKSPDILEWVPFTESASYAGTFESVKMK